MTFTRARTIVLVVGGLAGILWMTLTGQWDTRVVLFMAMLGLPLVLDLPDPDPAPKPPKPVRPHANDTTAMIRTAYDLIGTNQQDIDWLARQAALLCPPTLEGRSRRDRESNHQLCLERARKAEATTGQPSPYLLALADAALLDL